LAFSFIGILVYLITFYSLKERQKPGKN
jgi:hypothetical protein